ncbi:PREDICTED: uncharacterized protein LOC108565859 [Nicrophorus vespilloides]|uniref:Uncharacterized protein LOC108565859 n=1 Tax=Nicrophorus vespilloides TaxID=110193 RepID=A0ABM1N2F8_NICVS|nr:PREDICTED: uncharacterized protein LOC108565859 [Nicrophorus vespilloides]
MHRAHKRSALYKPVRQQLAPSQHRCAVLHILLSQIHNHKLNGASLGLHEVFTITIEGIQTLKAFAAAKVAEVNANIHSEDRRKAELAKKAEITRKLEYDRHIEEAIKAARAKRQEDAKKLAQAEKAKKAEMAKLAKMAKKAKKNASAASTSSSSPSKPRGGGKKEKKQISKSAECISEESISSDDVAAGRGSRKRRGPCFAILKSCIRSDIKECFSKFKFSNMMEMYFVDGFKVLLRRRYSTEML